MIDMENLLQLLGTPGKVVDAPNAPALQLAGGAVEFRDVVFGYERGVSVLKGVSAWAGCVLGEGGFTAGVVLWDVVG
jgi:ABC-type transport system involved in Fe-S cluster assembly fused permease/ATPase subunit